MNRYDWDWNRGYGRDFGARRPRARYGTEYSGWGEAWGGAPGAGIQSRGTGLYRQWGTPWEAGGYDRGVYGGDYPGYGGAPGGRERGMYFGGRGYAADYDRPRGGYDRGGGYAPSFRGRWGGGYDRDLARERFLPEDAYQRHPELNQPQRHLADRWPEAGPGYAREPRTDDGEIERAVRQSLYQDGYVDADRIEVEVDDQVVTLRGEVGDYLEARYAWDDAWETSGVRGVVNQLTVRTDAPANEHGSPLPQTAEGEESTKARGKK